MHLEKQQCLLLVSCRREGLKRETTRCRCALALPWIFEWQQNQELAGRGGGDRKQQRWGFQGLM